MGLEKAEFFLQKMREFYGNPKEFNYYLSAFLAALRSIPEYLLEEYNGKYGLNIPMAKKLTPKLFEDRARLIGHKNALQFIEFWKGKMQQFGEDSAGSLLFSKRNLDIHRKPVRPDLVKVMIPVTVTVQASIRAEKYDQEGKFVEVRESPREPPPKVEETKGSVDWFFKEYEDEPIITICERFLKLMKDFIREAHESFPP